MIKTYDGKEKYIFASYRHADAERVYPILAEFEKWGLRFWYDAGIHTGDEWDEVIDEHIEDSHAVIVFVSKAYFQSRNCREELKFARNLEKRLLLVYLEDAEPPRGLRMRLSGTQAIYYDKYQNKADFYEKLFQSHEMRECLEKGYTRDPLNRPLNVMFEAEVKATKKETYVEAVRENKEELSKEIVKKSWQARWRRRKKHWESAWNRLPGVKYLQILFNIFFVVELLMLALGNIVVLEGYLQYGYFHFYVGDSKWIIGADGIRMAAGVISVLLLLLGFKYLRKRMKSFWKYLIYSGISIALCLNIGLLWNMQTEIVYRYGSSMGHMNVLMGQDETFRGRFYAKLESDMVTVPRDINLVEIGRYEKEYGISWEEWDVTAVVETDAKPGEYAMYTGRFSEEGSCIEIPIPLSKMKCEYGLIILNVEGIEEAVANLRFGAKPITWYHELLYKNARLQEVDAYERIFSPGSWEWIARSGDVKDSTFLKGLWWIVTWSPCVAVLGTMVLGIILQAVLWYRMYMLVVSYLIDKANILESKWFWLFYIGLAIVTFGSFVAIEDVWIDLLIETCMVYF